ncbi:MAG: RagB/SusD family nutrient uptake outer membrane protein [Cyclobacteriaceae bacterium]
MKRYKIDRTLFGLLVAVLFAFSCESLEEQPLGFESSANTFQSIENFEGLVTGATRTLQQIDYYGLTASSQDLETSPEFDTYSYAPGSGTFASLWSSSYKAINGLNAVIENIDLAENGNQSQTDKILGKAYFLRAFAYFNMIRFFGDVPLVLSGSSSLDEIGVDQGRTPSIDVYAQIIDDLEEAEGLLPGSALPGEPTKGAAMAYLSKVYLTMAGAPLKLTENYAKAAAKAKQIIDAETYSLGDYTDNLFASLQNSSNSIIFQFIHSTEAGSSYSNGLFERTSFRNGITNPGSRTWKRFMDNFPDGPRKEAIFYMNSDPVVANFLNEKDANGNFSNEAFRIVNNIGEVNERKYFLKESQEVGLIKKYTYGSEGPEGSLSDQNTVMFRYAEVLLIYAEAQNMADNGANQLAYDALNEVRVRGLGAGTELAFGSLSTSEFDDEIIKERYWEFGFEMKRWFDVLRKQIPLTFDVYTAGVYEEFNAAFPTRYLFPIPQREMDLNDNLTQNDGY